MNASAYREQHLEPLPTELLRQPLEYILADHLRQRVLCVLCEQIADSEQINVDLLKEVLAYLDLEMAVHVIDEEQDLFPLIRRRAEAGDDIEAALGQLSGEHADDEEMAADIKSGIHHALQAPDEPIDAGFKKALKAFAQSQRHHLALENATVMPLAKLRLTERDLTELSARMAARRGILFAAVERE